MRLRQKQSLFTILLAELILWVYAQGWELTLAEGSVNPLRREFFHMRGSLHRKRLAQDLNLFVDGKWISDGSHPVWTQIGLHWEDQHPLCRWGGRFRDANHFSLEHNGRA